LHNTQDYIFIEDDKIVDKKNFDKYYDRGTLAVYYRDQNHPKASVYVRVADWNVYEELSTNG
jgi:hypothetical protein